MSRAVLFFGREPFGNINAVRCESFKTYRRGEHLKEITIRHDLHALSLLFQFGMKQGWCAGNPGRGPKQGGLVQIPSDKDAVRIHVLTAEEEAIYFQAAQKVSKDLYDVGRIMILQGCRERRPQGENISDCKRQKCGCETDTGYVRRNSVDTKAEIADDGPMGVSIAR